MKVELICFLYNKKLAEMEVKHEDILAKVTMDTDLIESVRELAKEDEDEVDPGKCMVHMKSGDSFQIGKSYQDMLSIWKEVGQIEKDYLELKRKMSGDSLV